MSLPTETPTHDPDLFAAPDAQPETAYIVLYGVGNIPRHHLHWIDHTRFQGGVALHVPDSEIKKWRRSPNGRLLQIKLLPDMPDANYDATGGIPDAIYDRVMAQAGIITQSPVKTAAVLRTTDIDALVTELGEDGALALYEQLAKRIPAAKRIKRNN